MKNRIFMLFMFAVALVTLTVGCEKKEETKNNDNNNNNQQVVEDKKIICTMTDNDKKSSEESKFTYSYKGNTLEKITTEGTISYNSGKYDASAYENYSNKCKSDLENTKKAGFTCNVQASGSSIWTTYQYTVADLNDEGKVLVRSTMYNDIKDKTIDEAKTIIEKEGFKCEIK